MKEPVGLFGLFKIINRVLFVINFSSYSKTVRKNVDNFLGLKMIY